MAEREFQTIIQLANDTASNWQAKNTLLLKGEVGIEIDTRKFKIGDGVTNWNSLLYANITDLSNYYTKTDINNFLGSFYTSEDIDHLLEDKVDKVEGKQLSTNDYTNDDKNKLKFIEAQAQVNVLEGVQVNGVDVVPTNKKANITVPTKVSELTNDSGYETAENVQQALEDKVDKVSGKGLSTNDFTTSEKNKLSNIEDNANNYVLPTDVVQDSLYVHTDNNYTTADRTKLNNIEANAEVNIIETVKVNGTPRPVTDKSVDIVVPEELSGFANDMGFIDNTVNNLANYYLKTQTYTKNEVNDIVNAISQFNAVIVTTLPTTNISTTTIYLVAKTDTENNDYYDEYIYINNQWEMIGNTKIDLSNYPTISQFEATLAEFSTYIEGVIDKVDEKATKNATDITSINTKVGNLETQVETNKGNITNLQQGLQDLEDAEPNQNAFSHVKVGTTTVSANAKTDTLILKAGENVTLTPNSTTKEVEIKAKDTTYGNASTTEAGLMSANDKAKLNGIESGANKYVLPSNVVKDSSYVHTDNNYTTSEKNKLANIGDGANVKSNESNLSGGEIPAFGADGKTIADSGLFLSEDNELSGADSIITQTVELNKIKKSTTGSILVENGMLFQQGANFKGNAYFDEADSVTLPATTTIDNKAPILEGDVLILNGGNAR